MKLINDSVCFDDIISPGGGGVLSYINLDITLK